MITIFTKNKIIIADYVQIEASTYLEKESRCSEDGEYRLVFWSGGHCRHYVDYPNKYEALNVLNEIQEKVMINKPYMLGYE